MPKRRPLTIGGTVTDGKLLLDDRTYFDLALKKWQGRVVVTVAPEVPTRSLRQQAWLWGVVYPLMSEESGYTPDELHELMRIRHNSTVLVDPFTGAETRVGKPTRTLDVDDYSVFIEKVMLDGSEQYGITWPQPRRHEDWKAA